MILPFSALINILYSSHKKGDERGAEGAFFLHYCCWKNTNVNDNPISKLIRIENCIASVLDKFNYKKNIIMTDHCVSSVASKPINNRWIRTGSQPY